VTYTYYPSRTRRYRVRPDGLLSIPFAEEVEAAGRTLAELGRSLRYGKWTPFPSDIPGINGRFKEVLRGAVAAGLFGQPGHADHEELVEVRGRDREELDAFEQRCRGVPSHREHAIVEREPGEVSVEEARAAVGRFGERAGVVVLSRAHKGQ